MTMKADAYESALRIEITLPNGCTRVVLAMTDCSEDLAEHINKINADHLALEQCRKDLAATEGVLSDLRQDRDGYQSGWKEGGRAALREVLTIIASDTYVSRPLVLQWLEKTIRRRLEEKP